MLMVFMNNQSCNKQFNVSKVLPNEHHRIKSRKIKQVFFLNFSTTHFIGTLDRLHEIVSTKTN